MEDALISDLDKISINENINETLDDTIFWKKEVLSNQMVVTFYATKHILLRMH